MTFTATYSPDDNKLRLTASARLDAETYARVRCAGFRWAPKQEQFICPMWTPAAEDLALELAGEIDDEDSTLMDRAEDRAERFDGYREARTADYESAHAHVKRIADNIPLGQPILVGHHSERHARKDAERIQHGMRRAVRAFETAQYWTRRAAAAVSHARYLERPDVRSRRIKRLEADARKQAKRIQRADMYTKAWGRLGTKKDGAAVDPRLHAIAIANQDGGTYATNHTHPSGYVGRVSLWEAVGGNIHNDDPADVAIATPDQVRDKAISNHAANKAHAQRWLTHYEMRLSYERAMLQADGGTVADKTGPEAGGGCKCWAAPHRGGWAYIQKVNKVSVTVLDNWGNGGAHFTRTIPFDKLTAVMTRADVEAARESGRLHDIDGRGFMLAPETPPTPPAPRTDDTATPADVEAMRASLRAGVTVEAVPLLFPTPRQVAEKVAALASIRPGMRVLEPSAGLGALLGALGGAMFDERPELPPYKERDQVVAVEVNPRLSQRLSSEFPLTRVVCSDFLACSPDDLGGAFDRIVMNPPFDHGSDIKHIEHARAMLAPGGRLVAICAGGPKQAAAYKDTAEVWIDLPPDTFAGTSVRSAIVVLEAR